MSEIGVFESERLRIRLHNDVNDRDPEPKPYLDAPGTPRENIVGSSRSDPDGANATISLVGIANTAEGRAISGDETMAIMMVMLTAAPTTAGAIGASLMNRARAPLD